MTLMYHWSSEVYGHGMTYRSQYKLPRFLPLPFYSDHGVMQSGLIDHQIIENASKYDLYLTFSSQTVRRNSPTLKFTILGTLHPWVKFKTRYLINDKNTKKIVLFFPIHVTPGHKLEGLNDDDSIKQLKKLIQQKKQIKICMHWHDFDSSRMEYFTNHGFEVVTLGNPYSELFVHNFYELAQQAEYVITESYSSAIPLFIDFGVPCSIISRKIHISIENRPDLKFGEDDENTRVDLHKVEQLFSDFPPTINPNQILFAKQELGYEFENDLTKIRKQILLRYITVLPKWVIVKTTQRSLKRMGIIAEGIFSRK